MVNSVLDPDLSKLAQGSINPVPDKTSASTLRFDYQLVNGRIFIRSRSKVPALDFFRGDVVAANNCQWRLFNDIGLPYQGIDDDTQLLLSQDEELVELAVASEIVVAVSNTNKVYLFKPTEHERPTAWVDKVGAPDFVIDELHIPSNAKAWTFGCSVHDKPLVRTTDFIAESEINSYSCDGNGVRHDFGLTATIYVLDQSGQKITYWDTGLPPSFSRGFYVPDGVEGLSLSTAGSTVFLSAQDANGKLHFYSRMVDYEISGPCPGLAVDYGEIPVIKQEEGDSVFLGYETRKLPWKDAPWKEHEMDEEMLSHLTDKVCIRLTGQGDESRELRIAAEHPEDGWGYYYKNITDKDWTFYPEPAAKPQDIQEILPKPSILDSYKHSYDGMLYTHQLGHLRKKALDSDVSIELEAFNPFQNDAEPFFLTLKHPEPAPDGTSVRLKLYAVDAWGVHYHNELDEQLIGHVDGEPKALIATLLLTPEQKELAQDNNPSPLGAFLKQHFLEYDGKTKAIPLIADNGMAILKLNHKDCRFERTLDEAEINNSFYMQKAMDSKLDRVPIDCTDCNKLIEENLTCLDEIKGIFSSRRKADAAVAAINVGIEVGHPMVSMLFKAYSPEDPTYKQAVTDTKLLFKAHRHATSYSAKGKSPAPGFHKACEILEERIDELEHLKANFEECEKNKNKNHHCCSIM